MSDRARPAQVIIAHQSAIPSYRIPFYELLEKIRPPEWQFRVVWDPQQTAESEGHGGASGTFEFPVLEAPVTRLNLSFAKQLKWQNFLIDVRRADTLILDTALSNIGYPLAALCRRRSTHLILWGHSGNLNSSIKGLTVSVRDAVKTRYLKECDTFFAYTEGQKQAALKLGLDKEKITVLNNTVDIESHRQQYLELFHYREQLRRKFGFRKSSKVLLVVGRLIPQRRIDFVLSTFEILAHDDDWRLVIVGGGPESAKVQAYQEKMGCRVLYPGPVTDALMLAELYVAADGFVLPGMVGLAPLEAICFELPVFAFSLPIHSPEFEYLDSRNSEILKQETTPEEFAQYLLQYPFETRQTQVEFKRYESIKHLTLRNMALNFSEGVSKSLAPI